MEPLDTVERVGERDEGRCCNNCHLAHCRALTEYHPLSRYRIVLRLVPPIEVAPRIACAHHSIVAALAALVFELRRCGDGVERLAAADIFS